MLEILKHVGELADGSGIVTLLRDDSLLPVIYVSASQADRLHSGEVLDVRDSAGRMIACEVVRIGDAFQPPPARVTRYYGKFEVVRPVALRPLAAADRQRLVLGDQIVWPMWQPLAFLWAQVADHEP